MHDTRPPAPPVLTPLIPSRVLTPCRPLRHAVLTPLIPSPFGRGETQHDLRAPSPEGRGGQGVRTRDERVENGRLPYPHSENPHTWHLAQPSANASCEPQSGQAPMKSCPSPVRSLTAPSAAETRTAAGATAPPSRSCCTPCFSCIHFSIAMPMASGTESTLLGPSPTTRSRSEEHTPN